MAAHPSVDRLHAAPDLSLPHMLLHQEGRTWEQARRPQGADRDGSQSAAIRTIIVPLDGSLQAEHALPHALAVARRSGAVIQLVHIDSRLDSDEPWQAYYGIETKARRKRKKQDYLEHTADRIARTDLVTVATTLIESTDTEESLLEAAADADLVVMASRRRGFFRRLWSYSVAEAVQRRLLVPVLNVRGYSCPVDLTGDPIIRHVLIPLDGSTSAERILRPATTIGRLEGAMLTVLNVQDRDWTKGIFEHTNPPGYLTGVARELRKSAPDVNALIVTTNRPIPAAVALYAEDRQVDLIALATRSDRGLKRLLRGSFADQLMQQTDLPILQLGIGVESQRADVTIVAES